VLDVASLREVHEPSIDNSHIPRTSDVDRMQLHAVAKYFVKGLAAAVDDR
jgi:hypothetical protein